MSRSNYGLRSAQQGMALLVSLLLLMVMSVGLAATLRAGGSTELSANSVRTQQLAMQAAEAALRHCERGAVEAIRIAAGELTGPATVAPVVNVFGATGSGPGTTYRAQRMNLWDGAGTAPNVTILQAAQLNEAGFTTGGWAQYQRMPECMAQFINPANLRQVIVTARGFGPEVDAADANRSRPRGTEVWLQSTLEVQ